MSSKSSLQQPYVVIAGSFFFYKNGTEPRFEHRCDSKACSLSIPPNCRVIIKHQFPPTILLKRRKKKEKKKRPLSNTTTFMSLQNIIQIHFPRIYSPVLLPYVPELFYRNLVLQRKGSCPRHLLYTLTFLYHALSIPLPLFQSRLSFKT